MITVGDRRNEICQRHAFDVPRPDSRQNPRCLAVVAAGFLALAGAVALAVFPTAVTSAAAPRPVAVSTASTPAPGDQEMPGMDMSEADRVAGDTPASVPVPTLSGWPEETHQHGSGDSPAKADDHGSGEMPGMGTPGGGHDHGDATVTAVNRPLAQVLGTFGGGTAVVLVTAAMMRRKDRDRLEIREAARAARRSGI
jgi:hypothetical protein